MSVVHSLFKMLRFNQYFLIFFVYIFQNEPECKTLVQECLYQISEIISRNHEDLDECDHTAESNPPNLDMAGLHLNFFLILDHNNFL